jgi:cell division protein FtsL
MPLQRPAAPERGLALGVLAGLSGLTRNPSLDRLIRGRTWIALIAFALIGIVTLQLLVLKLNANIGRALVREGQLQRENAALSIESSELAAGERVESRAARLGMQLVPEGQLRFLTVDPRSDIARAARALSAPVHTAATASATEASAGAAGASVTEASSGSSEASSGGASANEAATAASGAGTGASATGEQPGASATAATPAPASATTGANEPATEAPAATGTSAGATGATEAAAGGAGAVTQASGAG